MFDKSLTKVIEGEKVTQSTYS